MKLEDGLAEFRDDVFANSIDIASEDGTEFNKAVQARAELSLSQPVTFKGHVTASRVTSTVDGETTTSNGFRFAGTEGSATFGGTSDQTITGALTTAQNTQGNVTVSNSGGTVTFADQLGANDRRLGALQLNGGSKTLFRSSVYANALELRGGAGEEGGAELTLHRPVDLSGGLTLAGGSKITLAGELSGITGIKSGGDAVLESESLTLTGTGNVTVTLGDGFNLANVKLIDTRSNITEEQAKRITIAAAPQNGLYQYAATLDNGDIVIKQSLKPDIFGNLPKEEEATIVAALDSGAFSSSEDSFIRKEILSDPVAAAEKILVPKEAIGAAVTAAAGASSQVAGVTSGRLGATRYQGLYAGTESGFATGGRGLKRAVWLKPFGSWGEQKKKGAFKGFSTQTHGLAGGFDTAFSRSTRIGTALAWSQTGVQTKALNKAETDITSYQLTFYGDYTGEDYYLEGQLGYGKNKNSTTRKVNGLTAKGSYTTTQFMASVAGGVPINIANNAYITPTAGLSLTRIGAGSYKEKGAGGLSQKVSIGALSQFVGSLGVKWHDRIKRRRSAVLVPSLRAGLSYDFAGRAVTGDWSFTKDKKTTKFKGAESKRFAANAGLGLTYESRRWSVGFNYDAQLKSGYTGHSAPAGNPPQILMDGRKNTPCASAVKA